MPRAGIERRYVCVCLDRIRQLGKLDQLVVYDDSAQAAADAPAKAFMQMFLPSLGPANTTQVYRVFSNRGDANHRYMTDKAIRDQMVATQMFPRYYATRGFALNVERILVSHGIARVLAALPEAPYSPEIVALAVGDQRATPKRGGLSSTAPEFRI